jgi:coenzyme F420-0:L-glutamate ligase / coenzyme F420-1:gamma-L-glutamate ligase
MISEEMKVYLADQMGRDFLHDLIGDGLNQEEAMKIVDRSRKRILEAPAVIVLCLDKACGDEYPDAERQRAEYLMGVQSVALSGGLFLLAAHTEGLGGVWVCAPLFAQETVKRSLELPEQWEPQGMLLLGYPETIPEPRQRVAWKEITRFL